MIGELIDHYRILELVGRGAMGVVYKALDVNLDRQVAVKVMSAEARNDPDFVERFRQEARMQGALNHPNVAMLFDYFIHDGAPVAVMELIDGESLEQLIRRRGAIPAHECIPIFKQALRGVAAAHRAGIVHRDLKPSNLMVTKDNIVKVMDFGIAKRQGSPGATKVSSTSIGSPLYMAPEQILGRAVDCRTDIYALGLTLYELLSGNRPFNPRGKAEFMVLNAHVNDLPEPPTVYRFGIPQPLVDAVMRALAKDPNARFQSADEFKQALPDIPAATAAAAGRELRQAPVVAPRVGPTGTVALARGAAPSATMSIEYSPPSEALATAPEPSSTMVLEYAPAPCDLPQATAQQNPTETLRLDVLLDDEAAPKPAAPAAAVTSNAGPTGTLRLATAPPAPAATAFTAQVSSAAARPRAPRPRAYRLGLAALIIAALALGMLWRRAEQTHPAPPDDSLASASAATPALPSPQPAASPVGAPGSPSADAAGAMPAEALTAATAPASDPPPVAAPARAPARPDLAGTWSGSYVDASGKQLLRVTSLSISRVRDDGGIEGNLQYEAASGEGECQLHPRRSSYSAPEQRLLLSPESCSPHYPKELGVPLDFEGVSPQANTLRNGRIAAPAGQVIRVRLKRVSGT